MGAYITFVVGPKGSGKSMYEATNALRLIKEYYKIEKKYPQLRKRIYFSKQKFSDAVERKELWNYKDPTTSIPTKTSQHLYYWNSAEELQFCPRSRCWKSKVLHHLHDADVGWDEIGNDLQPDNWKNNPTWLRQIFSHARKRGNRIFANAQRYEMVDIHFRRQVDRALVLRKLFGTRDIDATRPAPKNVFVVQLIHEFDPEQIENEEDPRNLVEMGFPTPRFYTNKDVAIFDTQYELPPYTVTKMREVIMECIEGDKCTDPKRHRKVRHVPV